MSHEPSEEALQEEERRLSGESARASIAAAVLENDAFVAAVQTVRDSYHRMFATTDLGDDKTRFQARACLLALEDIVTELESVMGTGKMAVEQKRWIDEQRHIRDAEPGDATWHQ